MKNEKKDTNKKNQVSFGIKSVEDNELQLTKCMINNYVLLFYSCLVFNN